MLDQLAEGAPCEVAQLYAVLLRYKTEHGERTLRGTGCEVLQGPSGIRTSHQFGVVLNSNPHG